MDGYLNPIGCIVGNNGTILRTTDFGLNWSYINTGVTNNLNYIRFFDSLTCWATGSNGLIMKSTNKGLNWTIIPCGTNADIKSITVYNISINYFTYIRTLLVCGSGGLLLQSTNDGANWTTYQSNTQHNLNSLSSSFFLNSSSSTQFAVGDSGTILFRDIDSTYYGFRFLERNNIKSFFSS